MKDIDKLIAEMDDEKDIDALIESMEEETDYGIVDYLAPIAEGATLGLGDEISATMASVPAVVNDVFSGRGFKPVETYKDIRDSIRDRQNQFAEDNPAYNTVANMAGGVFTGGAGAGRAMATNAAKNAPIKALAGVGAAEGGAAGYGYSDEDTLLGDAVETLKGAGTGALLNPLVTKGAQKAVNMFRNAPQTLAGRKLAQSMRRDDLSADDIEQFLIDNPSSFPVDMPQGANLRGRGQAVARSPGSGRRIAEDALETRQAQMEGNIRDSLQRNTGGRFDIHQSRQDIEDEAYNLAKPLYDKAFRTPDGTARRIPVTRNMMDIKDDPQFSTAVNRAKSIFQRRYRIPPEGDEVEYWHFVKRNLDDEINKLKIAGESSYAGDLTDIKNSLLDDIKVRDYKVANKIWSDRETMTKAQETGRKALLLDADLPEIKNLTSTEKKMFINGAVRAIMDKFEGGPATANEARNLIKSTRFKKRMRNAFPNDRTFNRFLRDMERMAREGEVRGRLSPNMNSVTSGVQGDMGDTAAVDVFDAGVDLAKGNVGDSALGALRSVLPSNSGRNMSEEVSAELAPLLFGNNIDQLRAALASGEGITPARLQGLYSGLMSGVEGY